MRSLLAASLALLPLVHGVAIDKRQKVDAADAALAANRAAAVKEAFDFSWNGYYTYAFPNDELHRKSSRKATHYIRSLT